jgi:hypothetical protein
LSPPAAETALATPSTNVHVAPPSVVAIARALLDVSSSSGAGDHAFGVTGHPHHHVRPEAGEELVVVDGTRAGLRTATRVLKARRLRHDHRHLRVA